MGAVVAVLLASILFGTTGTARVFGPDDAGVVSVGAARIVIGGVGLAIAALIIARRASAGRAPVNRASAESGTVVGTPRAAAASPPPGPIRWRTVATVAIGAVGVVLYQPTFLLGTERNGVAVGTVLALGSAPAMTGALAWTLNRRFPGARWATATAVAILGVALLGGLFNGLAFPGNLLGGATAATGALDPIGIAGSLGAGLSYAVYTVASKALLERGWTPPTAMAAVFGSAAAAGAVMLAFTDLRWLATADGIAMALWLGLATTTVAYLLFARGLQRLKAATVSTLTLMEPLTATLLGVVVLGERLELSEVVGLAALTLGIALLVVPYRSRLPKGARAS